jgi:hypothetical protein
VTDSDADQIPAHLFKYRSLAGRNLQLVRELIVGGSLWFSSPLAFNDPFDTLPDVDVSGSPRQLRKRVRGIVRDNRPNFSRQQRLRLAAEMEARPERDRKADLQRAVFETVSDMAVCSFASRPDDVLMWSHYADHHRGLCVQIGTRNDYFARSLPFPITYQKERPSIPWLQDRPPEALLEALLTKADFWSYEREWRQVERTPGIRGLPAGAVEAVYLGCRSSQEDRAQVASWVKSLTWPVEVYVGRPSPKAFTLEFDKAT